MSFAAFERAGQCRDVLPDDAWCKILRHLPLSRSKSALSMVCSQWARCLKITDSYKEAVGYIDGRIALRQTLGKNRERAVDLGDLHPSTVEATVHVSNCLRYNRNFENLKSLTLTLYSHDECIKFAPVPADMLPCLEELFIDNTGDLHSTDHALEWDLRALPALQQVACDSLNETFEWDLRQLPRLKRVFCRSTRIPIVQLPSACKVTLELQLFMQYLQNFDAELPVELQPWSCVQSLHLDRLWVGASVMGEHPGRNQRLSLLGKRLNVEHCSLAVHFGDVLAQHGGKLIFPEAVYFESCDMYVMLHGTHAVGNCIGLCEKSITLPKGWGMRQVAFGTPEAPSNSIRGLWKGLDFRYYEPSEQTYMQLQLYKIAS